MSGEQNPQSDKKISPDLIKQIKAQIMEEMKDDETKRRELAKQERENAIKQHDEYINRMKGSDEPWVEIQGWVESKEGVRVELEWNDAFVEHLKSNGVIGTDDEQIVQKWIALLLHDMADQMTGEENQFS